MARKPTYEELEQRIKKLEKDVLARKRAENVMQAEEELEKHRQYLEEFFKEHTAELEKEISKRKRVEKSLQESEQKYRAIFEQALDGILIIDADTHAIVDFNNMAHKNLGYSREEFKKIKIHDFEALESPEEVGKHIDKVLKIGYDAFETKHRTKDGKIRDVLVSTKVITIGDRKFLQSIYHDINERKLAEESLRSAHQKQRAVFDAIQENMNVLDLEFNLTDVNENLIKNFGLPDKESVLGHKCFEIMKGRKEICPNCAVAEVYRTKAPVYRTSTVEDEVSTKGRNFEIFAYPIIDDHGNLTGAVEFARDITERKQAEETLQKSEKELRFLASRLLTAQENERKRIARDLHDSICQSLAAFKITVEDTLHQMNQDTLAFKSLETLPRVLQQTIGEIRRIITNLRPSVLDNLGILITISWLCREFMKTHNGIRIEEQFSIKESEVPEPLKVVIYRVLQEALNNIAKHSKAHLVHLSLRKTDETIELAIKDNGLGFDLEDVLPREDLRTGIGLTSMRERIELSGGTFAIKSISGRGTAIRALWRCKA